MVKKESAKRGYMNQKDIEEHLFKKGIIGLEEQREHLKKVLYKGKHLVSPRTYDNLRRVKKYGTDDIRRAGEFEKMGKFLEAAKIYEWRADKLYTESPFILDPLTPDYKSRTQSYTLASELYLKDFENHRSHLGSLIKSKILKRKADVNENSALEKVTATASIVGVLGGLFFLSPNMTGNAIANVSQSSSNIWGAVLLVVGLVAGFFWVKK